MNHGRMPWSRPYRLSESRARGRAHDRGHGASPSGEFVACNNRGRLNDYRSNGIDIYKTHACERDALHTLSQAQGFLDRIGAYGFQRTGSREWL